jgi:hypothetical protein
VRTLVETDAGDLVEVLGVGSERFAGERIAWTLWHTVSDTDTASLDGIDVRSRPRCHSTFMTLFLHSRWRSLRSCEAVR